MKLKGFMAENRIKQKVIAELLNLSVVTINQKINGRLEFTYSEVEKICDELGITTAFFNTKKVA